MKLLAGFGRRLTNDHVGAYAATCAYFLMISFVPFFMMVIAISQRTSIDITALTQGIISIVPAGLKNYVETIIEEVQAKTYSYMPLSILILLWSAAKVFHALSNGLNVISKTQETRGWFFLRFRSMMYVAVFLIFISLALYASMKGQNLQQTFAENSPAFQSFINFIYSFRVLFAYIGLILVFLFIYKFLPNCSYTFRSQLPGALITSTVWVFFSYLMTLYYEHNDNFSNMYGSLTGVVLAMIWIYFCMWFLFIGAELNRVIYEDPENNVIVGAIDAVKDASAKKHEAIQQELDEHSIWRPLTDADEPQPNHQPGDIDIPWINEGDAEDIPRTGPVSSPGDANADSGDFDLGQALNDIDADSEKNI